MITQNGQPVPLKKTRGAGNHLSIDDLLYP